MSESRANLLWGIRTAFKDGLLMFKLECDTFKGARDVYNAVKITLKDDAVFKNAFIKLDEATTTFKDKGVEYRNACEESKDCVDLQGVLAVCSEMEKLVMLEAAKSKLAELNCDTFENVRKVGNIVSGTVKYEVAFNTKFEELKEVVTICKSNIVECEDWTARVKCEELKKLVMNFVIEEQPELAKAHDGTEL